MPWAAARGSTWPLSAPPAARVQDTLPLLTAVPTAACPSPQAGRGTGTGMLPLCPAVMRFLLGCLDRKSQPGDAKSLSELWQPPAPAQPGAYGDAPAPAPTVQPGRGEPAPAPARNTRCAGWHGAPMACAGQRLCSYSPHSPLSQPHTATGAATPHPGWGCRHTPEDPRLRATTMPTLPPAWVQAPAPQRCWSPTLSGEVLAPQHHIHRTHVCRVPPHCAPAPPATPFFPTAAANPSP